MKTIALCMIVKNESQLILRCLESVRSIVDYVLIEDTGSIDGTQSIIREYLEHENLPGEVFDEPWRDFSYNRSAALARLREKAQVDYALIIDADDVLICDEGFDPIAFKTGLSADLYHVQLSLGAIVHYRPQICSNRVDFRYRGVLHEFIEGPDGFTSGTAEGFHILTGVEGARSQDPDKYRKDAQTLEAALVGETDPFLRSRYTFYLAQSYRDSGENEKALAAYLARTELGFWEDEVFISLASAARIKENLGHPDFEIIGLYMRAYETCPRRAESLHGAARYCRATGKFHQGYMIAKRAAEIPQPASGLFLEPWVYEYGALDELAVNAYWVERYDECLEASERLLQEGKIPERERVEANARFAREKLGLPASLEIDDKQVRADASSSPAATESDTALTTDVSAHPRVLLAILAKQKEPVLPFYLTCIDALDYPKASIVLYVRTNNNTDRTADILRNWLERVGHQYAHVEFDASDVAESVDQFGVHEWNSIRFKVLARIRHQSMQFALQTNCDFYFVVDVDNFLKPHTLKSLISANAPIVAPLLRHEDPTRLYSNYHEKVDTQGYFVNSEEYNWILFQRIKGFFQVPVVHCTYLVRCDVIPLLSYDDGSGRHEYVVFSDSARHQDVQQYLDNRDVYGYLTLDEKTSRAIHLLGASLAFAGRQADIVAAKSRARSQTVTGGAGQPIFIHSSWRTSSTWFWSKFRQLPTTLAFYEPFNHFVWDITREGALARTNSEWDSGHPEIDPYFLEYLPLIRRAGGVRLAREEFRFEWFVPDGGLQGELRKAERRYLALLIRETERRGRVGVFGFCDSLGRVAAIKRAFGGLNIFLFRNLWSQWASYIKQKRRGGTFFYDTVPILINRADDPFLAQLSEFYLARGGVSLPGNGGEAGRNLVGTNRGHAILSSLPEHDVFAMFMALHIYLYLYAQVSADLTIDVARMAQDHSHRAAIEGDLRQRTKLPISFSDVRDEPRNSIDMDVEAIDWEEIERHALIAARHLREVFNIQDFAERAIALIAATRDRASGDCGASRQTGRLLTEGTPVAIELPGE